MEVADQSGAEDGDQPPPGDLGGNTTGMVGYCPPPSMASYTPQPVAPPLLFPETGFRVTGVPCWSNQMDRYWVMGEMRGLQEVSPTGSVRLGDKVGNGHLPTRYLLTRQVVRANGDHYGYACPCGTHVTRNKE